jgi:DNA-binding MarR family transcriptional regulator
MAGEDSRRPHRAAGSEGVKMSMDDVLTKPGHLFRRMQQIAVAIFIDECASFDLTPVQFSALVAIREHRDVDATRLSALIAFDRSTLGDVIERLEAKGLVLRRQSREDRRTKVLRLSATARKLLREVMPAVDRAQDRMLGPLEPDERRRLMHLLERLVEANNEFSRAPLGENAASENRRAG